MTEILAEIGEKFVADANKASFDWREKMLTLVEKAVRGLPNTYIVSPFMVKSVPPTNYSAIVNTYLIPVVLTSDTNVFYDHLRKILSAEGIFGIEKFRYYSSAGSGVTYMMEIVLDIFPIRDEQIAVMSRPKTNEGGVSYAEPKYFLPLIYRMMEESVFSHDTQLPSPLIEMEEQWSKQMTASPSPPSPSPPPSSSSERDEGKKGEESEKKEGGAEREVGVKQLILTGSSAALFEMGEDYNRLPRPIECVTDDLDKWDAEQKSAQKTGIETRRFVVNHPSGHWYVRVSQVVQDGRLTLMCYDSLRYFPIGIGEKKGKDGRTRSITAPFTTMVHLCYSSWLLERKNIARYKQVNQIYQNYREWIIDGRGWGKKVDRQKDMYSMYVIYGEITPWRSLYYRQPTSTYPSSH